MIECKICGKAITKYRKNRPPKCCSNKCAALMRSQNKKECPKCSRKIAPSNFKQHVDACNGTYFEGPINPSKSNHKFSVKGWLKDDGLYHCPDCGVTYDNHMSMISHYYSKHTKDGQEFRQGYKIGHNPNIGYENGTHVAWNKGLTKNDDPRLAHSDETKEKLRKNAIENPRGVALLTNEERFNNGWSKLIPYIDSYGNDCVLESTWEWLMANQLDKNGIKWRRAMRFFIPFEYLGKQCSYTPDFWLPDYDIYLDPKGWENPEQMERIDAWLKHFKKDLIIITEKQLGNM